MKRFWDKVKKTATCWIWTARRDGDGYGQIRIEKKTWQAHRYSALLDGRDPKGFIVMHTCDNPWCVNPAHLILGTQLDNVRDMINKGRYVGPPRKLSDEQVRTIRNSTDSNAKLGQQYNISGATISYIKNKRVYKDVI